jgi:hypothetical protein
VKLSAVALLALVAGCRSSASSPANAVRALAEASREGDVERVARLIGPKTRARLQEDARRAAVQAGRRAVPASDLLAVGWTPPRFDLERAKEISRSGDTAVVEVEGRHGERDRVTVVRDGPDWKVELP